jgi:uncharacterized protein YecE (DUF72 family)
MGVLYRIGTSGWHYDHWRGRFYPVELPKARWLDFYAQRFLTVELNNSFYHLPSETAFTNWRQGSPPDFTFAVKASRFITHLKKLRNTEEALGRFLERARLLQEKLAVVLYQLPPNAVRNEMVLEEFLVILPKDLRHAFEFRHPSWFCDGVYRLLTKYNAGFCVADMPGLACPVLATADFAYVRFHGTSAGYWGCYSTEQLQSWAQRIVQLGRNREAVFVYFNNDAEAFAVRNAAELTAFLTPNERRPQ